MPVGGTNITAQLSADIGARQHATSRGTATTARAANRALPPRIARFLATPLRRQDGVRRASRRTNIAWPVEQRGKTSSPAPHSPETCSAEVVRTVVGCVPVYRIVGRAYVGERRRTPPAFTTGLG